MLMEESARRAMHMLHRRRCRVMIQLSQQVLGGQTARLSKETLFGATLN